MRRWVQAFTVFSAVLAAGAASAQERAAGAGRLEVSAFPGGGILFTEGSSDPDFGNYALGASLTYHINRYWGVEGEVGGAFGVDQSLTFRTGKRSVTPPNTLAYNGNVLVYPTGSDRRVIPYATGGAGGLTMFERRSVGVDDRTTFFSGNVGGGVKYYINDRWGLRGDYRFFAVKSKDDAPAFFGHDTRYGHRLYGGIILNVLRQLARRQPDACRTSVYGLGGARLNVYREGKTDVSLGAAARPAACPQGRCHHNRPRSRRDRFQF